MEVEALVFSPLAAAEAVLEDEEKDARASSWPTSAAARRTSPSSWRAAVFHTCVLPVGGYHLTHDLVAGLRAPYSHVEELKLEYGSALPSQVDAEEIVEIEAVRRPAHEGSAHAAGSRRSCRRASRRSSR